MKKIQLSLYALMGVSLVVSISAAYIVGALLVTFWIFQKNENREMAQLDIALFIYFGLGILIVLFTGSTRLGKAISSQSALILFFLFARGTKQEQIKMMLIGFCVASAFVGLLGGFQYFSGIDFDHTKRIYSIPEYFKDWPNFLVHELSARNGRPIGTRSHPLTYAEGFIPVIFIMGGYILREGKAHRLLGCVILGLSAVGFILSQGRAVWLGTMVGMLFFSFMLPKNRRWIFMGVILLGGSLVMLGSPSLRGRALSIVQVKSGSYGDQESKSVRYGIWKAAIEKFKEKPILGYGTRGVKIQVEQPPAAAGRTWTETHNVFLQVLLERGIIGFLVLIWILILISIQIWNLPDPWRGPLAGIFIAFMVAGLTESWLNDTEVAMIFWSFMGMAYSLGLKQWKEEKI